MNKLWLDFETWSSVPIRRGSDVYMDNAKAIIATYAFDDGPVQSWDAVRDYRIPLNLYEAIDNPLVMIFNHNVPFDRMVLRKCLGLDIPITRFHCTYAQALAHSLPGGLDPLCTVLGVPQEQAKIKNAMKYIRLFCGPKPCDPMSSPQEWTEFIHYACMDVEAMRECFKRMPNWNYKGDERHVWEADQRINERGFSIDMRFATNAIVALDQDKMSLDEAVSQATGGKVTAVTQRDKMLMHLAEEQGCFLKDLTASTINQALEDESLEESTRELLRLRNAGSKSSNSKYKRLVESVGKGGRLRNTLQYSGANRTARWAGRIFQPQNLPRAPKPDDDTYGVLNNCIDLIRTGRSHLVPLYASVSEVCSKGLRGLIVAEPGNKLVVADWSAIEGRVNAWIAGEQWRIDAFKKNEDLYCRIYERSFGLPVGSTNKKTHPYERQIGKVLELFGGYGGGVGACINMSGAYNVDLDVMGAAALRNAPEDAIELATKAWEQALKDEETYGLAKDTYIGCDVLKILYRRANPAIAKFWYLLEEAVRTAISERHQVTVGPLVFDANDQYMRIKLPSGRYLTYAIPKLSMVQKVKFRKPNKEQGESFFDGNKYVEKVYKPRPAISYMAWRNKSWSRTFTYGGKLDENIVQAINRDLLAWALLNVRDCVLHIHDEIICEVPKDAGWGLDDLIKTMTKNPPWARGLPLAAEGFEGTRYEK